MEYGFEQRASFSASGSAVSSSASPGVKLCDKGKNAVNWLWVSIGWRMYSHRSPACTFNRGVTRKLSWANRLIQLPPTRLVIIAFFV